MTANDATPDELRTTARMLRRPDFQAECGNYAGEAAWFERLADEIDAGKQHVKHLANIFRNAGNIEGTLGFDVEKGIRAVLDTLDEETTASEVIASFPKHREPRAWATLRSIPNDVDSVHDRNGGNWIVLSGGWGNSSPDNDKCGPFTEIIEEN